MSAHLAGDLTYAQVIIPVLCFPLCVAYQAWEFRQDKGARAFFKRVREGWIDENTLKGQQAVNTTRDYIRASVFFANTAILLSTFVASYAATRYSACAEDSCSHQEWLLIVKLGLLVVVLMTLFFVFTQCTRFAVHFSFLINTRAVGGRPLPKSLMLKVFNRSHRHYSMGIRLYFGTVPVYAWLFSEWALLVIIPLYLYMVRGLEDLSDMAKDIEELDHQALTEDTERRPQEA